MPKLEIVCSQCVKEKKVDSARIVLPDNRKTASELKKRFLKKHKSHGTTIFVKVVNTPDPEIEVER